MDINKGRSCYAVLLILLSVTGPSLAATITIFDNNDLPGVGLKDTTPVEPVGGNPGTTLGEQRFIALQFAADIWGSLIESPVEIRVGATFAPLKCSELGGILGTGGPGSIHRDFNGAPIPGTWYVQALANARAGVDLAPDLGDIYVQFSSVIGVSCPLFSSIYYGLDGSLPAHSELTPNPNEFVTVALHEIGHGLGFIVNANIEVTGALFFGFPGAYERYLENPTTGKTFPDMTDAERLAVWTARAGLHWVGSQTISCGNTTLTAGRESTTGHVEIDASLVHFGNALRPNPLMQPHAGSIPRSPGLELCLLRDLGWMLVGDAPPPPPPVPDPPPPPAPSPNPPPTEEPLPPPVIEEPLPPPAAPIEEPQPSAPEHPRVDPVICNSLTATIVGTEGNDIINGTPGPDVIHGLGGRDVIRGLAGNDVICGGAGKDKLFGQAGRDRLIGGPGVDLCDGGSGTDKAKSCSMTVRVP